MATVISILVLLVSIVLILVVLVQNPKGGGLAAGFSGGNQVMGARRTTDFLEKATWGLAGVLLLMSIVSTSLTVSNDDEDPGAQTESTSTTREKAGELDAKSKQPAAKPTAPAPAPGAPGQPGQPR